MRTFDISEIRDADLRMVATACKNIGLELVLHEVRELQCVWLANNARAVRPFDPLRIGDDALYMLDWAAQREKYEISLHISKGSVCMDGELENGFAFRQSDRVDVIRHHIVHYFANL